MQINFLDQYSSIDLQHLLVNGLLTQEGIHQFRALIYSYYNKHKREFAWRNTDDPYHIIVSEVMLQQTQTERVKEKYEQFISTFPSLEQLAGASIAEVLKVWQGLGYNRRALALHALCQKIVEEYKSVVPQTPETLQTFKGIGAATAASICAFAFNSPTVFIETNIRAVFIHHFFLDAQEIGDKALFPLVEQTVDKEQPRIWYYALMDYGVMLKKTFKNPSRKSAHYTVQSKFEGSRRQLRGMIIKELVAAQELTVQSIVDYTKREKKEINEVLQELIEEGFVKKKEDCYFL